jgi:hypothetical protein
MDIEELTQEVKQLRIRIARLESEREQTSKKGPPPTVRVDTLKAGDRIRITNKIRRPVTWPEEVLWTEEKERVGTVTHLTRNQVHFRFDNGRTTWRATKNIRKIPEQSNNAL